MNTRNSILVVDDIEANRAVLAKIFEQDYLIFTAENGAEALETLGFHEIDMVLLDLDMPVMDGYETIRAMRADQAYCSIPIIVTTGAMDKSERRAFDLGADDFIVKPYDPYVVRKRVENLIQKYVLQLDNLRQALNQAEQLNKAKSSFLSRMSHDLRSPINSIVSLTNLMKDEADNPVEVVQYADKITQSSKYLLGVINDILDVSALENQKIVITRSPFSFRRQIESVSSMFYGQCKERGINFELNLEGFTEEYLFGDPLRLKEILINLMSNAVKFTPSGGKISMKVSQLSRVNNMVMLRFEVSDTGEGIAKDRQEAIFKPYTQETDSTVQTHGGSGLGLSIVKSIVELMGGHISVKSDKGEGASFTVDLPFTVAKDLPEAPLGHLENVRALIVDDDPETQEYGKKVMSKLGISCDVADSGPKALEVMRKAYDGSEGYDICFVDWRMPGTSGIEITKAIRSSFNDDTVIVVASAYDLSEITQEAKMAGADLVVPKPMFQSTVFDLLMEITGGAYQADSVDVEYDFSGKRVLLAEDNNLNADIATSLLTNVGFDVERVADGKAALETLEASEPGYFDGILMDVQMPVMDGRAATRAIRACNHVQATTIPIIAVTASAFTKDVRASLEAGMNDHISKPIDTKRLYEALDKLVGQTTEPESE